MTTQELIKWILEFCYSHYVLTTVFLLAIVAARPFGGMIDNRTYYVDKEGDEKDVG